jgi:hypothetical protein
MSGDARGTTVPLVFSPHAHQRRIEMALTSQDVLAVVDEPTLVYPASGGRVCYVRDPLVVVVDTRGRKRHTIVTVLWHGRESRD